VRGAFSILTAREIPQAGVVAASGGNFGLAVAHAAGELGRVSTIFVPETSPREKVMLISRYDAEVRVVPGFYSHAFEASREFAVETGAVQVHAYDQMEVVAGQGTCALEIEEQVPDVTTILVAVGGGGLIAGVAGWVHDRVRVVGVEPVLAPTLAEARRAGGPVDVEVGGVAASSLGASRLGDHAWAANQWIDGSVLVSDQEILEAQVWLWDTCRILAEPAACAPIAALLTGVYAPRPGESVVAVISGANTSAIQPSGRKVGRHV
jgi:threonine dehydratase